MVKQIILGLVFKDAKKHPVPVNKELTEVRIIETTTKLHQVLMKAKLTSSGQIVDIERKIILQPEEATITSFLLREEREIFAVTQNPILI